MKAPFLGAAYARSSARIRELSDAQLRIRDSILSKDRPGDYEQFACPCGADAEGIVVAQVERHGLDCRTVICPACGLIGISPRWTQARYRRFYETEYRALYTPLLAPPRRSSSALLPPRSASRSSESGLRKLSHVTATIARWLPNSDKNWRR